MKGLRTLHKLAGLSPKIMLAGLLCSAPSKALPEKFDPYDYKTRFGRVQSDIYLVQEAIESLKEFEDLPVEPGDSLWGMTVYAERMADRTVNTLQHTMVTPFVGNPPRGTSNAEIGASVEKTIQYHAHPTRDLIHADPRVTAQLGTRTSFNVSFTTLDEKMFLEELQDELHNRLRNLVEWEETFSLYAEAR